MQKHVNLVDLVKSFPTSIYLQNLASIQERTSPCEIDSRLQNCRIAGVRQNIGAAPGARPAPAAPGGPGADRPTAEGPGPSELGTDYYFLYLRKLAQKAAFLEFFSKILAIVSSGIIESVFLMEEFQKAKEDMSTRMRM